MKKFVKHFIILCILLSLYSSEIFARTGFVDKETGKEANWNSGKTTYNVYPKYFADDNGNTNTNNSNGNGNNSSSGSSGGSSGGSGDRNSGLRAVATEPNRFIGLSKNFALKQFPAEEFYKVTSIKEGEFAGQLRVRSVSDKLLYGFYKIKSMYNNDVNVYFFDFDAKIYVGFLADATGDIYYFSSDGTMITGKKIIQGVEYDFNDDGALKPEYLSVLKAAKPNVYCVNSSEWQQQANGKWKLIKKNFYGEIEGYYTDRVMLRYDQTKNDINAYVFDKDGLLVENDVYIKENVLCNVSKDPGTRGQVTNLVVPDMKEYLNKEIFNSEVQLANFVLKWIKK